MIDIKKLPNYPVIPQNLNDNGKNLISTLRDHIVTSNRTINNLIDIVIALDKRITVLEGK